MEAILQSFFLVAVTEMGDKTQLLAFVLASRFRKPWAVLAGIFVATVLNHLLATVFGSWIAQQVSPEVMKWALALTFIGFGAWVLIPDKDEEVQASNRFGAFLTTTFLFFLAEMGDKTQLSTVALAAQHQDILLVTLGTTAGMMFSDGLAVVFGEKLTQKISMKWIRYFCASMFVIFGLAVLLRG